MSSYDQRITTYFGDAVLRAGFMPVPHLLMRHYHDLGLQADHAMFVMQLMEITWDLAQPPRTMKKIADRMGVSLRTVQRYSEFLSSRGLVTVYEQFENGAQVENGYDLSPLFRRLAELAPEPPLSGAPRERRVRGALPAAQERILAAHARDLDQPNRAVMAPGVTDDIPPGDSHDTPPIDTAVTPHRDTPIAPRPDTPIVPGTTRTTGLKDRTKKTLKNNKKMEQSGSAVSSDAGTGIDRQGRSLRWQTVLQPSEIDRSRDLLDRAGVHRHVAAEVAPTLAPAEVWALLAYARAAKLGAGWIASQVFDFAARTPRSADLSSRYDPLGRALAELAPDDATRVLDLADRSYPNAPELWLSDPWLSAAAMPIRTAADLLQQLMRDQRGATATQPPAAPVTPLPSDSFDPVWRSVLDRARQIIPSSEYLTWLEPTVLLDLTVDRAVVGTANIFAREHVDTEHRALLTDLLTAELGRPLQLDIVIGAGP